MISFGLIKKWIKDHMKPTYMEDLRIPDDQLIGEWIYTDENTCYKFVETVIGFYRRRLLVTAILEDMDDGNTRMTLVSAEEVEMQ